MAELLKRSIELFIKKRWLKTIDKECDKYNKIKIKLSRQQYVVNSLLAEYKKIYGEDLRTPKETIKTRRWLIEGMTEEQIQKAKAEAIMQAEKELAKERGGEK